MALLPFWTSFQDLLTRFIMTWGWYKSIQEIIVPYELKIIGTIMTLLGFPIRVSNSYIEWTRAPGVNEVVYLAWNCVGWQTVVLFLISIIIGLSGKHTVSSKFEALIFGILGTYLVNIARIMLVVVVYFFTGRPFGIVFHDYFSNLLTLAWLLLFWWFSYKFILEEKSTPVTST